MTTLLQGVNDVMKRSALIQGDSGELATLSDSPRQVYIDKIVQTWNEVVEELYSVSDVPMPSELGEATITLVAGDRDYALNEFTTIHWPLVNESNGQYIYEFRGGYTAMWQSQPIPSDYTGLPRYGCIRETDGQLYFDRIPTSSEAGLVYKYRYDKDVSLSLAADTFPFKDAVYRALIPVVAGIFRSENRKEAISGAFASNIGRAARILSNVPVRTHYGKQHPVVTEGVIFPFEE